MYVLMLESDPKLASYLELGLRQLGHQVEVTTSGREALDALLHRRFDVAALERLPQGLNGLAVTMQARVAACQTPIMLIAATNDVADHILSLESGADDYLVKPFVFSEFAARLVALARRTPKVTMQDMLIVQDIEMNLRRRSVKRGGRLLDLPPKEFAILEYLMRNPNEVLTKSFLLERIWKISTDPRSNILEAYLCRLRAKLKQGGASDPVRTVRGVGYVLDADMKQKSEREEGA